MWRPVAGHSRGGSASLAAADTANIESLHKDDVAFRSQSPVRPRIAHVASAPAFNPPEREGFVVPTAGCVGYPTSHERVRSAVGWKEGNRSGVPS